MAVEACSLADGITVGFVGGALAGLTVWLTQYVREKGLEWHHEERVYNWLSQNTANEPGRRFRSTRAIASYTNLTEDRVRYICSVHSQIALSTGEREDMWGPIALVRAEERGR